MSFTPMIDERVKAGAAVLQELIASRRLVGGSLKVDEIARLVLEAAGCSCLACECALYAGLKGERDCYREFVDNLIADRYFGGGWADKIIAAAKEARDA